MPVFLGAYWRIKITNRHGKAVRARGSKIRCRKAKIGVNVLQARSNRRVKVKKSGLGNGLRLRAAVGGRPHNMSALGQRIFLVILPRIDAIQLTEVYQRSYPRPLRSVSNTLIKVYTSVKLQWTFSADVSKATTSLYACMYFVRYSSATSWPPDLVWPR